MQMSSFAIETIVRYRWRGQKMFNCGRGGVYLLFTRLPVNYRANTYTLLRGPQRGGGAAGAVALTEIFLAYEKKIILYVLSVILNDGHGLFKC